MVTMQMKDPVMPGVQLEPPPGLSVETPGVRVLHDHQISWRVRPLLPNAGDFKFRVAASRGQSGLVPPRSGDSIDRNPLSSGDDVWLSLVVRLCSFPPFRRLVFGLCWKR